MSANRPAQIRPLTLAELVVLLLVAWTLWAMSAHARLVPLKTAPLVTGSQFQSHPPHACSMGSMHSAVDDTLDGTSVNPTANSRLDRTWAHGVSSRHAVAGRDSGTLARREHKTFRNHTIVTVRTRNGDREGS